MGKLLTFDDYDFAPPPDKLLEIYESGFAGTLQNAARLATFCGAIDSFRSAVRAVDPREYRGRAYTPYKAALALTDGEFGGYEAQTTGDCVSHATRNAGMIDYCIDALFGETEYRGVLATENIYGARAHGGQGAECWRLADYVSQRGPGGFLPRALYKRPDSRDKVDLSVYDSRIGHNWGRHGTPDWLNEIADDNKALRVYRIDDVDEAILALSLGFGISCCGTFSHADRNEDGVAKPRRRIAHAEAWIGVDDTEWAHNKYGGPLLLEQNSWGDYISGGKRFEQPDGSYFIQPRIANRVIEAGGCFVIASIRGLNRAWDVSATQAVQELSND